ncbi:signal peptidase I [Vagococcus sp. JNUCC 83]
MKKIIKDNILLIVGLGILLLVQMFIVAPTRVSGESMNHTLQHNDRSIIYKSKAVNRFDIVVFNTEELTGEDNQYVKRVISLPGETLTYKDNQLFVNHSKIDEPFDIRDQQLTGDFSYTLANDEYFVLGDNRGNSTDSRQLGGINKEYLVGKMIYRFYPLNSVGKLN